MKKTFTEIFTGFMSLVTGMGITIKQFFKPTVTLHYPHESLPMTPRFRGHIELVADPKTGQPLCIACGLCQRACPSNCITVEGVKPASGRKVATHFELDFTKCSLCGSCVEACKTEAIRFSKEYNKAGWNKDEFIMDLLKRLDAVSKEQTSAQPSTPSDAVETPAVPTPKPDAPNANTPAPVAAQPEPPKAPAPAPQIPAAQ